MANNNEIAKDMVVAFLQSRMFTNQEDPGAYIAEIYKRVHAAVSESDVAALSDRKSVV